MARARWLLPRPGLQGVRGVLLGSWVAEPLLPPPAGHHAWRERPRWQRPRRRRRRQRRHRWALQASRVLASYGAPPVAWGTQPWRSGWRPAAAVWRPTGAWPPQQAPSGDESESVTHKLPPELIGQRKETDSSGAPWRAGKDVRLRRSNGGQPACMPSAGLAETGAPGSPAHNVILYINQKLHRIAMAGNQVLSGTGRKAW